MTGNEQICDLVSVCSCHCYCYFVLKQRPRSRIRHLLQHRASLPSLCLAPYHLCNQTLCSKQVCQQVDLPRPLYMYYLQVTSFLLFCLQSCLGFFCFFVVVVVVFCLFVFASFVHTSPSEALPSLPASFPSLHLSCFLSALSPSVSLQLKTPYISLSLPHEFISLPAVSRITPTLYSTSPLCSLLPLQQYPAAHPWPHS